MNGRSWWLRRPALLCAAGAVCTACGGSVRPSGDGGGVADARADAVAADSRADSGARDVTTPDVRPTCPAGETALGRCDGTLLIRCVDGAMESQICAADTRCVASVGDMPARCEPLATGATTVTGRVQYARRPLTTRGLGTAALEPLEGVTMQLLDSGGTVRGTTTTDGMGFYTINADLPVGAMVTVRARAARSDTTYQFSVENFSGAVYGTTSPAFAAAPMVTRDLDIAEANNAGAYAIFDTIRDGLDFVRRTLPRTAPNLRVRWERGRTPPGGTSYFVRNQNAIYLLGGPSDSDEFDLPVIFHEFGHFVEQNYSRTSSPGGSHDGSPTDPRLAWGEGWGTWFGCRANGDSRYLDALVSGGLRVERDLANLPMVRANMGDPAQPISQQVGEYLVGGSLWALSSAGMDPAMQLDRMLGVSLRYFTRSPAPDRGVTGVDFVDFLDGYLCLHGGVDRSVIEGYVVMQRRFPYDFNFAGVCR